MKLFLRSKPFLLPRSPPGAMMLSRLEQNKPPRRQERQEKREMKKVKMPDHRPSLLILVTSLLVLFLASLASWRFN